LGESIEARVWHLEKIVASLLTLKGIYIEDVNFSLFTCLEAYAFLPKRAALVLYGRALNSYLRKILKNETSIDRETRCKLAAFDRI
jgi:hypothetical protein